MLPPLLRVSYHAAGRPLSLLIRELRLRLLLPEVRLLLLSGRHHVLHGHLLILNPVSKLVRSRLLHDGVDDGGAVLVGSRHDSAWGTLDGLSDI